MKLYVMRHGPAEDAAGSGRDFDRALTASGRDRVRSVAKALASGGEAPIAIVTSPLVRAVQTAEIAAVVTDLGSRGGSVETDHALAPGGNGAALARRLAADGRKRVMLVGHEPDLSMLVAKLLGGSFDRPFEKAMVVGLRVSSGHGEAKLRFVLEPRSLRWDDDARSGD